MLKRSVSVQTTLTMYGPTTYGAGHVKSFNEMTAAPDQYRPSVSDSLSLFDNVLEYLYYAGVPIGSEIRITFEEV